MVIANGDSIYWGLITLLSKSGPLVEVWQKKHEEVRLMDKNSAVLGIDKPLFPSTSFRKTGSVLLI